MMIKKIGCFVIFKVLRKKKKVLKTSKCGDYHWESAVRPRYPSEPQWSPAGTRWRGLPHNSAAACRSGCDQPAQPCEALSDLECPQHWPGVIKKKKKRSVSFIPVTLPNHISHRKKTWKQTLAPCFCSTSRISLWALSAATCKGVIKLKDGTDEKLLLITF